MKLIGLFSIIAIFIIGGIYFGFSEFFENNDKNLFSQISGVSNDDFQYVGEVELENNSINQDNNQKNNNQKIADKSAKQKKKTTNLNENVAKVVSAADIIATSTEIVSAPAITGQASSSSPIKQEQQEQNQEQQSVPVIVPVAPIVPVVSTTSTTSTTSIAPVIQPSANHILISEIMAGIDGNANYEFIEIYNPTANSVDLTGWSIKKRSSTGTESTLVSSNRFEGKIILTNKYFLLVNEGGYGSTGSPQADVFWPKSYTLAYSNNAIIIYNANDELVEEVSWTEIPKDQSIERESFSGKQFKIQPNPNPQNSSQ